jgi:flagellar hook assembly protein FlgD
MREPPAQASGGFVQGSMTRFQLWFGTACAALVLLASTAIGDALATATVSAGAASGTISTTTTSVTVPVTISRPDNTSLFGFSVNFTVSSLAHGVREPGAYRLEWDGRDASGALAPPGVYYAQFTTEGIRATRKLTYLR